jgi:hypothetical protein
MNFLSDVITYIRRIIKSPSNSVITDALIIDYINRFWIMDVDARIQLFDLKKTFKFQTIPGVDRYNMPLYNVQTQEGNQAIGMYPVYQGFLGPLYINGIQATFYTLQEQFYAWFPNYVQDLQVVAVGDGSSTNFTFQLPILSSVTPINSPVQGILRGHVDMGGIIATGNNVDPPLGNTLNTNIPITSIDPAFWVTSQDSTGATMIIQDSGQFLSSNVNCGLLMTNGTAPFGYSALSGGYSATVNTVNYLTGEVNVTFPLPPADGVNITAQCFYFQTGLSRGALFYDNTLTLRMPPSQSWLVEVDGYLTPSAFLSSADALPYAYMAEYIARGAARKLLADTGDTEQFAFYEPLFREQEQLVWKRSQRQFTATRTPTIYSQGLWGGSGSYNSGTQL